MMPSFSDRQLLAYAARSLDPGATRAVEEAFAANPELRRRLAALEVQMDTIQGTPRWHLPVVPLPDRAPPLEVELRREMALGDDGALGHFHPGDHVGIRIAAPGDARRWRPVIVREAAGRAEVVHPTAPGEWVSLNHWPAARGSHWVDIVVDTPGGDQRYVLILAAEAVSVDWSAEPEVRWAALRADVEDGRVPAASLTLHVDTSP